MSVKIVAGLKDYQMMKKIIELANEVCNNLESQDGIWLDSAIMLRDAINVRRKLEQTPITEEWLKEHGWKRNGTTQGVLEACDWENCDDTWCHPTSDVSIYIDYPTNKILFSQDDGYEIWLKNTLADLYDACELCGITMED